MSTTATKTVTVKRVTHVACDNCGDHGIRFRDLNTVYLDPQCAASVIRDADQWAEFAGAPVGPAETTIPAEWLGM